MTGNTRRLRSGGTGGGGSTGGGGGSSSGGGTGGGTTTTGCVPTLHGTVKAPPVDAAPSTGSGSLQVATTVAATTTITVTGSGFTPNENVQFVLYSSPHVLGSEAADGGGTVTANLTIPTSASIGSVVRNPAP